MLETSMSSPAIRHVYEWVSLQLYMLPLHTVMEEMAVRIQDESWLACLSLYF